MVKKVKIIELYADIKTRSQGGEEVSVTVEFMDGFTEANTQTKASMLLCMMDVLGTFMQDHGSDIFADAHEENEAVEAAKDAEKFLARCVQRGRLH